MRTESKEIKTHREASGIETITYEFHAVQQCDQDSESVRGTLQHQAENFRMTIKQ